MRTVAVDWSGRESGAGRSIWVAQVASGELCFLENGRRRDEVAQLLVGWAAADPDLVVGLDFAFSMPAWYLRAAGLASAPELWRVAASDGERWLAEVRAPFWGRRGRRRPDLGVQEHFRATERAVPSTAGIRPKSTFQVGGAGAVGTGSIRGMAVLSNLHDAGFSIWPFDRPRRPCVVEIYPRLLTGPVRKTSMTARSSYLGATGLIGDPIMRALAASTEDAFDAAVSAISMWRHRDELAALPEPTDELTKLEGLIWSPKVPFRTGAPYSVPPGST